MTLTVTRKDHCEHNAKAAAPKVKHMTVVSVPYDFGLSRGTVPSPPSGSMGEKLQKAASDMLTHLVPLRTSAAVRTSGILNTARG